MMDVIETQRECENFEMKKIKVEDDLVSRNQVKNYKRSYVKKEKNKKEETKASKKMTKKTAPKEINGKQKKSTDVKKSFDPPLLRSKKTARIKKEYQESEKYINDKLFIKKGKLNKKN